MYQRLPFIYAVLLTILLLIIHPARLVSQDKHVSAFPKNVILMIGDGMGYNCIKASDYYFGPSALEQFPVSYAMATCYAGSGYDPTRAWTDTAYISDDYTESAAGATALSTGHKTSLNTIGLSAGGDTLMNLTEFAKSRGKATGVITSVPICHATAAGFLAHNRSRTDYGRIAFDILFHSRCDVIMGCGNPEYDDNGNQLLNDWNNAAGVVDSITWAALKEGSGKRTEFTVSGTNQIVQDINNDGNPDPWTVITSDSEFTQLATGHTPLRILGIPHVYTTLQQGRSLSADESNASPPFMTPFNPDVPELAGMVTAGINVLDNNPAGFFLMVEGGAIDWANHANRKGRMLEEMKSFRDAVDSVISWVNKHSSWEETLLIVTADHECGNLWGGPPFTEVADNGMGTLPGLRYNSTDHTNALVPLYARGAGAFLLLNYADETDPRRGPFVQNNEIPALIISLWEEK